jgi:hypothetical protein
MQTVTFTRAKTVALAEAAKAADDADQETFMFDNKEYVLQYAKYLVEYLTARFEGEEV